MWSANPATPSSTTGSPPHACSGHWRARCRETGTPGSGGGRGKRAGRHLASVLPRRLGRRHPRQHPAEQGKQCLLVLIGWRRRPQGVDHPCRQTGGRLAPRLAISRAPRRWPRGRYHCVRTLSADLPDPASSAGAPLPRCGPDQGRGPSPRGAAGVQRCYRTSLKHSDTHCRPGRFESKPPSPNTCPHCWARPDNAARS